MNTTIKIGTTLVAGGSLLLGLSGCSKPAALTPFEDCDELEAYIHDLATTEYSWSGSSGDQWGGFSPPAPGMGQDMELSGDDDDGGGNTNSYSTTNTQEKGVDEADFVKNDGEYIYVLNGQELAIIDAWPAAELQEVSRQWIEGEPLVMYLDGDIVAVLSQLYEDASPTGGISMAIDQDAVKITLIDVSDRTAPVTLREVYVEGALYDSRRVDERVYLITQRNLADRELRTQTEGMSQKEVKEEVQAVALGDWMPKRAVNTMLNTSWESKQESVCDCQAVYRPNRKAGLEMMSVLALDISDLESEVTGTSVLAGSGEVYATPESLYLAVYEPDEGPFRVTSGGFGTRIHKFDLEGGPEHPIYEASGRVDGWIHNAFAMDEANDTFRIATTRYTGQATGNLTGVFVLEQTGSEMDVVGQITDLAPNEDVYAVRFTDDAAYVVTFLVIDPLFTIDLTDPKNPEVMGELHVTGYSTYLHPMDADHLLAIGEEVSDDGWEFLGVQVSLFDVSDMTHPVMSDREVVGDGWSSSSALFDHHAFNYYQPLDMLAVPMTIEDYEWDSVGFSGLYVYDVTVEEGITLAGTMDATDLLDPAMDGYYAHYCAQVRRSIIIEDVLYGVASGGIVAAPVNTPDQSLATLSFPDHGDCEDLYYDLDEDW